MTTDPDISILTPRDRRLVDAGFLPIDVDPPRPLSELERIRLKKSTPRLIDDPDYEPMVGRGYLFWRKRP